MSTNTPAIMPGTTATQGYSQQQLQKKGETAETTLSALARAQVEARYIASERHPRNIDDVAARLLRDCERPSFAEMALYSLPRKVKVDGAWKEIFDEGLSIRFAEAAVRSMGNIECQSYSIYEDAEKRIVRIQVVDLEANNTHSKDLIIEKLIEKRFLAKGAEPVSQRTNSRGEVTYLVRASADETMKQEASLASRTLRTLMLRTVPGWIQDECLFKIRETRSKTDAQDPDAAKRRLLAAFAAVNIMPSQITDYMGCTIEECKPDDLESLRKVWTAVKDGNLSWAEAVAAKRGLAEAPAEGRQAKAALLMDKVRAKTQETAPSAPQEPDEQTGSPPE